MCKEIRRLLNKRCGSRAPSQRLNKLRTQDCSNWPTAPDIKGHAQPDLAPVRIAASVFDCSIIAGYECGWELREQSSPLLFPKSPRAEVGCRIRLSQNFRELENCTRPRGLTTFLRHGETPTIAPSAKRSQFRLANHACCNRRGLSAGHLGCPKGLFFFMQESPIR